MVGAIITKRSIFVATEFLESLLKTLEYTYARYCILNSTFFNIPSPLDDIIKDVA